jgi:hypothetical protein
MGHPSNYRSAEISDRTEGKYVGWTPFGRNRQLFTLSTRPKEGKKGGGRLTFIFSSPS